MYIYRVRELCMFHMFFASHVKLASYLESKNLSRAKLTQLARGKFKCITAEYCSDTLTDYAISS